MKAKPRGERGWWLERTRGFYLTDSAWEIRGTMADWGEFYDGFALADPVHVALWRLARLQRREIERLRASQAWFHAQILEIRDEAAKAHALLTKELEARRG